MRKLHQKKLKRVVVRKFLNWRGVECLNFWEFGGGAQFILSGEISVYSRLKDVVLAAERLGTPIIVSFIKKSCKQFVNNIENESQTEKH